MTRPRLAFIAGLVALAVGPASFGVVPDAVPNLPLLEAETKTGSIVSSAAAAVAPTPKKIDGEISDWKGRSTRLAGTAIYSRGEYVYQDYIGDGWGADDAFDAQRLANLTAFNRAEPRLYRIDSFQQAAGAQFGASRPFGADLHYGDVKTPDDVRIQADIEEARVAADAKHLFFLVRTLGMKNAPRTAVLVLLDTRKGGSYALPRAAGGITTGAEWAFLVNGNRLVRALYKGVNVAAASDVVVASNPTGYTNAVEIGISRRPLHATAPLRAGIATGIIDNPARPRGLARIASGDARSDLVNVAFRHEPARIWMDEMQALALRNGNIDQWLTPIDTGKLARGATETFRQSPGYYEAVYEDAASKANFEGTTNAYYQGAFQHYGLYLPKAYRPGRVYPATFWFHYRGGHAHDAAAWLPGVMREFGDETGGIVVTPSARGESSWYTGRGMVDYLDVWRDLMARYRIDPNRVYIAGHSMGGWASYLLGLLMPDRWAAANPEDGPLAPGLWTGVTPPSDPQDGADLKSEFLYNIIGNARNLPYAILHGTEDELVPITSAYASAARYQQLGYRFRLYDFHTYEHYSAPIWDDWREIVRYMTQFRRDPRPARVTYSVWPALDHAVSTISMPRGQDLGLTFNSAYWVSGLTTRARGLAPSNIGTIDAVSYRCGVPQVLNVPEAGTAGQAEPYTMIGQRWLATGDRRAENRFTASLTNIGSATLDLRGMGLRPTAPIIANITTDGPTGLILSGWRTAAPTISGASAAVARDGTVVMRFAKAGTYTVTIRPRNARAVGLVCFA